MKARSILLVALTIILLPWTSRKEKMQFWNRAIIGCWCTRRFSPSFLLAYGWIYYIKLSGSSSSLFIVKIDIYLDPLRVTWLDPGDLITLPWIALGIRNCSANKVYSHILVHTMGWPIISSNLSTDWYECPAHLKALTLVFQYPPLPHLSSVP